MRTEELEAHSLLTEISAIFSGTHISRSLLARRGVRDTAARAVM